MGPVVTSLSSRCWCRTPREPGLVCHPEITGTSSPIFAGVVSEEAEWEAKTLTAAQY